MAETAVLDRYVAKFDLDGESHAFRDGRAICGTEGTVCCLPPEPVVTCGRCQRILQREMEAIERGG